MLLIGLLGLIVSVGCTYWVTKRGVFYTYGTPVRRDTHPLQFWLSYLFWGFLILISCLFIYVGLHFRSA